MASRPRAEGAALDAALVRLSGVALAASSMLPAPVIRVLFACCGALVATLSWPLNSTRRRAARSGLRLRPWSWGGALGASFADLLTGAPITADEPVPLAPQERGTLVLAAHLGSWEAGAAELARRGLKPCVLAAPWPRLPRSERRLAALRRRRGVRSIRRSASGWKQATRRLRAGESVLLLVDSARPFGAGRRPASFADGPIAAPDAAIAWARRQGSAVWVAVGRSRRFWLHRLAEPGAHAAPRTEALSDRCVELLRAEVRARPAGWAWVRALACVSLLLSACDRAELPPLPVEAEAWEGHAEGVAWSGPLEEGLSAGFVAERAVLRWEGGGPVGRFEAVELTVDTDVGERWLSLVAEEGEGAWPGGPLSLHDVAWTVLGRTTGEAADLTWVGGAWSCGGCPLEAAWAALNARGTAAAIDALEATP